ERAGMGPEKLDVAVYTIRGLLDLAAMAASRGDRATAAWATSQATGREQKFQTDWWYGGAPSPDPDSVQDPGNAKLFQRYWIGAVPMEASLPGGASVADTGPAMTALTQRERDCFTGDFGFFHTGTPGCDSVVSAAPPERDIFSLGNAVM